MKIICYKKLIITLTIIYFILIDLIILLPIGILCRLTGINLVVYCSLSIIGNIIFGLIIAKFFIKKCKKIIYLKDNEFEYISKNERFVINKNNIEYFSYKRKPGDTDKMLKIHLYTEEVKVISLPKNVIKQIAKKLDKNLIFDDVKNSIRFKNYIKGLKKDFINFIKDKKYQIIASSIGLLITIFGLILYFNNKNNVVLTVVMCIISFIYCMLQLFFLYLNDKNYGIIGKIFLSIIAIIVMFAVFLVALILCSQSLFNQPNFWDNLIISFLILPSFIIVVGIIILIVAGIGYA